MAFKLFYLLIVRIFSPNLSPILNMPYSRSRFLLFVAAAIFIPIMLLFTSCSQKNNKANDALKLRFGAVDSLYLSGDIHQATTLLNSIHNQLDKNSPLLSSYYSIMSKDFITDATEKNIYADSALALFTSENTIKEHSDEYFNALLTKGDACFKAGKYVLALNYYFESKKILGLGICDDGELSGKMAMIYYSQENYLLASKFWVESYERLGLCEKNMTQQKMFYLKQGALNNAGFAYEKAGMPDSANYYYLKDLSLINETDSDSLIDQSSINVARAVLYDNLGGINLSNGNLAKAQDYITKSLALFPVTDVDGSRIPPLIKLAELKMKLGDNTGAADAFRRSRMLLDLYYRDNSQSLINWNKLYADYLFKINDAANAYRYKERYIKLKDSVNNSLSELYRLDVVRELDGIQQKQTLIDFEQRDKLRIVYLVGIITFIVLFIVILVLIYRNLKKTKKNHALVTVQNEHMQQTVAELERVNQNYIRIMRVMAHDLRNPLSGITGLAAVLIEDEDFNDENKSMLRLIETTGLHSMEMINELLKTGLADENEKLEKQRLDLRSLLYDSVELLQFKAADKQQQIIFESDGTPVMAEVNHEKIWRVVNNLIVNAIKFSHIGGIIKVGIRHTNKHVLISVADNGIGIPADQKESVFEMFTPAKKVGTDGEQPFGLGLSISKKIIEMHRGRIWFVSNVEIGTTFYIELPYSE